jgi:glycerophosphoryl diester phosphodiesterase
VDRSRSSRPAQPHGDASRRWHDNGVSHDRDPGPPFSPAAAGRPAVIAHRGASEDAPEHTLAAYRMAIEAGADALECDVRLTADGHLVCVHDRRVNRTSNGRGAVSRLELADLAALDSARGNRKAPTRTRTSHRTRRSATAPPSSRWNACCSSWPRRPARSGS